MGYTRAIAIYKLIRVKDGFWTKPAYISRLKLMYYIQRKPERDNLLFDTEIDSRDRDVRLVTVLQKQLVFALLVLCSLRIKDVF